MIFRADSGEKGVTFCQALSAYTQKVLDNRLVNLYTLCMKRLEQDNRRRIGTAELQQRIINIYNHLYANGSTRTPAGICAEVGKILHVALFLEENKNRVPAFDYNQLEARSLLAGDGLFTSSIPDDVREWFHEMNDAWKLYGEGTSINVDDFDVRYICSQLNGIVVSDRNRDVFGDALEIFRSQWVKRTGGQFFTDQRVTSLAMALLDFDPRNGDDLVDICAGTGGFLLAGLNHIEELLREDGRGSVSEVDVVSLATKALKGQEVDTDVCDIANATLLARLGTVHCPIVTVSDSLRLGTSGDGGSFLQFNSHLCAASNPPFGTKITIKDPEVLRRFDLAYQLGGNRTILDNDTKFVTPRAPDILFLEQNIRLLKPGWGRLAIVLPYQILSGPQTLFVREWLIKHAQIQAVIDLPPETFQPHTGTKASLVVVKRRSEPLTALDQIKNEPVFVSMPRWIGHDRRGNPVYRRTEEGQLTDQILSDFEQVRKAFEAFQRREEPSLSHPQSFQIRSEAIIRDPLLRMNALFHRPLPIGIRQGTTITHESPWRTVRLADVVERIFYPGRFKRNYVDYFPGAVPFLGGSNISQLDVTTDKWLHPDDKHIESLRVSAGWLLITRSGSTGIISSVPEAWDGYAMSEHIIRIIPDPTKLNPYYLQAFLRSGHGQTILAKGVFGSVIDEITPEFIGDIGVPIPSSPDFLSEVIATMCSAEQARQIAIQMTNEAIERLNREMQI